MKTTTSKLRIATELGVSMTIIASLLTACGGGGGLGMAAGTGTGTAAAGTGTGTATAGAATTTTNITPFKGRFNSGTVNVFDKGHNPIGSGAINPTTGGALVTYLKNPNFPLILEVYGNYNNEFTGGTETSTNLNPIRGFIKDQPTADAALANAASGIPVTSITEIEVASLPPSLTGLTPASAVAAIGKVETLLGLAPGDAEKTPVFTSAGKTDDAMTLKLAALSLSAGTNVAGTGTLSDKIRSLATTLAGLNAASSPNQVPAMSGLAAAMTAITSGASTVLVTSGASAPTFIASASSVMDIDIATASSVATINANAGATSSFLTDMTTTGLRKFQPGSQYQYANASGVVTTQTWYATGTSLSATLASGVYTITHTMMELINKVWAAITGTSNNAGTQFVLDAAGNWVDEKTLTATFMPNADGTATANNVYGYLGTSIVGVSAVDLSGTMSIASAVGPVDANGFMYNTNASGVQATLLTGNITFPPGSKQYAMTFSGNTSVDNYLVWVPGTGNATYANDVRDPAGIIAPGSAFRSAHNVPANPVCANGTAIVFSGIVSATNGPSTADVYFQQYNTATNQYTCAAIPAGTLPIGTVTFTPNAAGTIAMISGGTAMSGPFMLNHTFLAMNVNGAMRMGNFYPAGTPAQIVGGQGGGNAKFVNKTAADAAMGALGFPAL